MTKVQGPRAELPITAIFEDGPSRLAPLQNMYGATGGKEWVLLSEVPPGMELELQGFAKDAYRDARPAADAGSGA